MAAIGYRQLKPEMADTQHTTLRKLLDLWNRVANTDSLEVNVGNHSIDAFGRLRVSNPTTELEAKHTLNPSREWSDIASGTGSIAYNSASSTCTVRATPNGSTGSALHQTLRRAYYQPGKSQLCLVTFSIKEQFSEEFSASKSTASWAVGMGDSSTGIFLTGTARPDDTQADVSFQVKGLINATTPRSSWTVDKLDGTGPSGKTITFYNTTQIAWFDAEWLGVGDVRAGFVIDGEFIHCHTFKHNNTSGLVTPYSHSMNLPIRYIVQCLDTGQNTSLAIDAICGTIVSEGGRERLGYPYCARRATALATLNDSDWYAVIGLRLNYATDARAAYAIVEPVSYSVATDNALFEVGLFRDPTVAGTPTWATLSPAVQAAVATTNANKITAGVPVSSQVVSGTNQSASITGDLARDFRLGISGNNTPEALWMGVRKLSGNVTNIYGTLNLRESY